MGFQILLFIAGALFWWEAKTSSEAFNVTLYGSFALQYPAELWAGAMMGFSTLTWIGLIKPIRKNMVSVGAIGNAIQFMLLSYSAVFTGGEFIVGVFASLLFLTPHVWLSIEAVIE
jgi:hypothetical protein